MTTDPTITAVKRRLARWELPHLRELCVQQAERIEQLERELQEAREAADWADSCASSADNMAHMWREMYEAEKDGRADALQPAITIDGRIGLVEKTQ